MTITLNLVRGGKVKKSFASTSSSTHAEEVAFKMAPASKNTAKVVQQDLLKSGNLDFEMDGWPCVNEKHHDCNALFLRHSQDPLPRTLTVVMTADSGGYKASHAGAGAAHTTITYTNGVATYG